MYALKQLPSLNTAKLRTEMKRRLNELTRKGQFSRNSLLLCVGSSGIKTHTNAGQFACKETRTDIWTNETLQPLTGKRKHKHVLLMILDYFQTKRLSM